MEKRVIFQHTPAVDQAKQWLEGRMTVLCWSNEPKKKTMLLVDGDLGEKNLVLAKS